jgi:murein DD-endopeptidase MepM/ murein hydrolase activator NlpD
MNRQVSRLVLIGALVLSSAEAEKPVVTMPCSCTGYFNAQGKSIPLAFLAAAEPVVRGTRISSVFGPRINPITGVEEQHMGTDLASPTGATVHAAGAGVVEYAGIFGPYGNYLRIRHGPVYATAYGHLSAYAPDIHTGARVSRGQAIGRVGTSGVSRGSHLHFEIQIGGRRYAPCCTCAGIPPNPSHNQAPVTGAVPSKAKERVRTMSPSKPTPKEGL